MNKIEPDMIIFVGGPMDGRARRCDSSIDYLDIPMIDRNGNSDYEFYAEIKKHRYRRVRFTNRMSCFASDGLSDDDVMRYLLLGCRQP